MATRDGEDERKRFKDDSTSSSGAGEASTDIKRFLGVFFWDKYPAVQVFPQIEELLNMSGSGCVISVSPDDESGWRHVERVSAVIIICQSQRSAALGTSLRRFLDLCFAKHGSENMTVVITDLEDTKSEKRRVAEWIGGDFPRCPLMTLTEAEMDVLIRSSDGDNVPADRRMARKVIHMMDILQCGAESSLHVRWRLQRERNKAVIGIFSRDAGSHYSWLLDVLRSHAFMEDVAEVRPCYISNNGFEQFSKHVSHCTFGILYHSKNRGRINVTNVNSSLYDEELKYLCTRLGQKKVIVVIDDLSDSGEGQKNQILKHQPSIRKMAEELFLISPEEKTSDYQRRLLVDREQLRRKLQVLEERIRRLKPEKAESSWPPNWQNPDLAAGRPRFNGFLGKGRSPEGVGSESSLSVSSVSALTCDHEGIRPHDPGESASSRTLEEETSTGIEPAPEARPTPQEKAETSWLPNLQTPDLAAGRKFLSKWKGRFRSPEGVGRLPPLPWPSKKSVGIFSRSSESEYVWLKMLLGSKDFSHRVRFVHSCYVTNDFSKFYQDACQCKFGILYHTKKRGRINVTDVMDSLYDEELKFLSNRLGKENVVVVIDDLEDTRNGMRENLLRSQHSIQTLARDLILVQDSSLKEKMSATKDAFKNVLH